jgi:hypothetical protein
MSQFATFAPHLRRLGFRKDYSSRAGGERCDIWERWEPIDEHGFCRQISVQLWEGGGHRASHMVYTDPDTRRLGRGTTHPTEFTDEYSLIVAVKFEATRMDNKRYTEEKAPA